jgi:hypothetical protein
LTQTTIKSRGENMKKYELVMDETTDGYLSIFLVNNETKEIFFLDSNEEEVRDLKVNQISKVTDYLTKMNILSRNRFIELMEEKVKKESKEG